MNTNLTTDQAALLAFVRGDAPLPEGDWRSFESALRRIAADVAERVLVVYQDAVEYEPVDGLGLSREPAYERVLPDAPDLRPVIAVIRRAADGNATDDELDDAQRVAAGAATMCQRQVALVQAALADAEAAYWRHLADAEQVIDLLPSARLAQAEEVRRYHAPGEAWVAAVYAARAIVEAATPYWFGPANLARCHEFAAAAEAEALAYLDWQRGAPRHA